MPDYLYKAANQEGVITRGRLRAHNVFEVERRLESMGYDLITQKEINPNRFSLFSNQVKRKDLINFTYQMEQLTRSGVALLDGLKDLRDSLETSQFKDILTNLIEAIEGGKTFSEALKEYPNIFDNVFVSLVAIGEESGQLPRVLKDLAESMKWIDELIAHTKKIMIYPSIVLLVVMGVVTFLMIYLVPQLIPFIKEMGGELPIHTKALIWTSELFTQYWYIIFSTPIFLIIIFKYLLKTNPSVRLKFDGFKLKIPLLGSVLLKIKLARFASYFALMYSSGVSVLESIRIGTDLMDNKVLENAVAQARQNIADGTPMSQSFANIGLFPPLVVRMLKLGEDTGQLDNALLNISYFYDREVQEAIDKLEPALEPLLTVAMGGMMAWIMVSVLGPVYDIITKI